MKPLSDFFPRMLPYLPACSKPLAAQALLDSAIAFCVQSDFVREVLEPQNTVAGLATYELDVPSQQQVARVLRVRVGDRELQPRVADGVHFLPARDAPPTHFHMTRAASTLELRLYPTPDGAYPLVAEVSLCPTRSATQLEDDLFDIWVEPVVAGAVARAMMVPGQPFTDQAGSQFYMAQAQVGIHRARREGILGRTRGSLSVRQRAFS